MIRALEGGGGRAGAASRGWGGSEAGSRATYGELLAHVGERLVGHGGDLHERRRHLRRHLADVRQQEARHVLDLRLRVAGDLEELRGRGSEAAREGGREGGWVGGARDGLIATLAHAHARTHTRVHASLVQKRALDIHRT